MNTPNPESIKAAYAKARTLNISDQDCFPQLGLKVLIVGDCFLGGAVQLFSKAGCTRAKGFEDAELVVFLGGADINPKLYEEKACRGTYYSDSCDARDIEAFEEAEARNIPMFGICRGMQFLHAMAGGKLYQDVRNHTTSHNIIDVTRPELGPIRASSMHHQMCIEFDECFPVAYAEEKGRGSPYIQFNKETSWAAHRDLEAAVYFGINAIAVQGHPEVGGYPEYSAWCIDLIKSYISEINDMNGSIKHLISRIGHNSKPNGAYIVTEKGKKELEAAPLEEKFDEGCS